jgi:hypothetical protein
MNKRNESPANDAFTLRAKKHFDESVENLDAKTRSQLNRSRQAALAELNKGGPRWIEWAPAAGVAAAAVVAVVLWTGERPTDALTPATINADIEILLTEDSFEMLEDLEFYSWIDLDEELEAAGGNVG